MGKNYKWTSDKIELLQKYYPNSSWEELYKILGTDKKTSILSMASKLKISKDSYNNCHAKPEEIEYIKNNATYKTAAEIARDLNRCDFFVNNQLKKLRIKAKPRGLKKEDEELFIKMYPHYTNKYLHNKFFSYLDEHQLRTAARKFNLVKTKEKAIKWYDKEQLLEDLENAIKDKGRTPMINEFTEWGLASESTYRRYFGTLNNVYELMGMERNNYLQPINKEKALYKDKAGNWCLSLSEVKISNFLFDQNVIFEKEVYYHTIMPIEECHNKRFDWKIGNKYIEFFGLTHYHNYDDKTSEKIRLCKKYNVNLLSLYPNDLLSEKWKDKIKKFLNL